MFLLDELNGARLQLQHPQPAGIALQFDQPWEGVHPNFVTVIQDGALFKMWYRATSAKSTGEAALPDDSSQQCTCYAQSTDGIHWTRPSLGLFEINGSRDNNGVLYDPPYCSDLMPFLDTRPGADEGARFKARRHPLDKISGGTHFR